MKQFILLPLVCFFFVLSLFFGLDVFFHHKSSRFSPKKIYSKFDYDPRWALPDNQTESRNIESILNQKWTFFNKGSQAYAFISEDKQYILKFFKQHKLTETSWLSFLPIEGNPFYEEGKKRKKKADSTFAACKLAFCRFPKQTGILHLQINPSPSHFVTLIDKQGKTHRIDLGRTSFLLQKKAGLIYPRIEHLMEQGKQDQAKTIISDVLHFLAFLGSQGVIDNDPIIRKNFGLIDDKTVQIDVGKFRIEQARAVNGQYKKEIRLITTSFKEWLENRFPELSDHFEKTLQEIENQAS
jgi:hypothetical protein